MNLSHKLFTPVLSKTGILFEIFIKLIWNCLSSWKFLPLSQYLQEECCTQQNDQERNFNTITFKKWNHLPEESTSLLNEKRKEKQSTLTFQLQTSSFYTYNNDNVWMQYFFGTMLIRILRTALYERYTVKKRLATFPPSLAGMSPNYLWAGTYSRPGRAW